MIGRVEFINRLTGTRMTVTKDRVDEYKAAGHIPAAVTAPKTEEKAKQKRAAKK